MPAISVEQAGRELANLVDAVLAGEEVVIARGDHACVRLVPAGPPRPSRRIGGAPGLILQMADDFDAPLDDFGPDMT